MSLGRVVQVCFSSHGGVPKRPIARGEVTPLGIVGDSWAHPQIHGGPRQALLIVAAEALEQVSAQGFSLYPGALGENLTVAGLAPRAWRPGQRYRAGGVTLELTKLRWPCDTLSVYGLGIQAALYGGSDPSSPRWALGGFYAAVVEPGSVAAGDPVTLVG